MVPKCRLKGCVVRAAGHEVVGQHVFRIKAADNDPEAIWEVKWGRIRKFRLYEATVQPIAYVSGEEKPVVPIRSLIGQEKTI